MKQSETEYKESYLVFEDIATVADHHRHARFEEDEVGRLQKKTMLNLLQNPILDSDQERERW